MSQRKFFIAGDNHEFDAEQWAFSSQNGFPKHHLETHINILINIVNGAAHRIATAHYIKIKNIKNILIFNKIIVKFIQSNKSLIKFKYIFNYVIINVKFQQIKNMTENSIEKYNLTLKC